VTAAREYIEDVMYGRRKSPVVEAFLRLLSLVYGLLIRLRHGLVAAGVLKRRRLSQRVISVGNVTLGGTGKTPAVMALAVLLEQHDQKPVVVSRGYGRSDESRILVVSDGSRLLADTTAGGDEPVLIGSRLERVPVVVGSDRFEAARFACGQFGSDTVVLDDGFQHVRLRRDLDIVLIDAVDPFGNGRLFPAGILREPLSALRRAQVVLITGADRTPDVEPLKQAIRRWTAAQIFTSRHMPTALVNILTGDPKPLAALRGTRVLAFAGIARPQSFIATLGSLEADVRVERTFADHYHYGASDLAGIYQAAADHGIAMIVTTEKDGVRLKSLRPEGIWLLRIELAVTEKEAWETAVLGRR